jgi:hypothetical protein
MLAKIYYNALMTSLNSRRSTSKDQWKDFESRAAVGQMSLSFVQSNPGQDRTMGVGRGETVVHISTSTERDIEAVDSDSMVKTGVCVLLAQIL